MTDSAQAPGSGIKGEVRLEEPQRWERAVIRRSAEARATVPDLEVEMEARVEGAVELAAGLGCGMEPLLARACALALAAHPRANGAYRDGRFERYSRVNLGVVLAGEGLYAVATLFDADRKPLEELVAELGELRRRAQEGQLSAPELSGATFTLWDAGAHGLTRASVPVVPPQAGMLVAGAPRSTPFLDGGAIVPGHAMTLSLACDHRIMYGSSAATFLGAVTARLEAASL